MGEDIRGAVALGVLGRKEIIWVDERQASVLQYIPNRFEVAHYAHGQHEALVKTLENVNSQATQRSKR